MGEERNQRRDSWEDLALPDEYPEPCLEDEAKMKEETGENASVTGNKGTTDPLQLPKAAGSRGRYSEPSVEDGAEVNDEAGEKDSAATEENTNDRMVKCSTDLLQMLKAAEQRRSSQSRSQDRPEASEAGIREMITEALKANMVSKDTVGEACIDDSIIVTIMLRITGHRRKHKSATTSSVNDLSCK